MSKLPIQENKKLVLKNVIKKELRSIKFEEFDNELQKFSTKIELLKVQVFGPLVIKACGMNVSEEGIMTCDYDLFTQAHDYKQYKNEFVIEDRHVVEHCVYLHYEGNPEDVAYAHSKLDLHFYEHDLHSDGVMYSICLQESEDYLAMDFFKPVVSV